jgi:hypothetical protein
MISQGGNQPVDQDERESSSPAYYREQKRQALDDREEKSIYSSSLKTMTSFGLESTRGLEDLADEGMLT